MATSFLVVKNRAYSKLAAALTSGATTVDVTAGEGSKFPSTYPFHITIEDEILEVTNVSTDTLTFTRAAQGTSAVAHPNKAYVALNITAKSVTDLNTAVNTLEAYDVLTTRGDIIYRAASAPARLAKGADNTIMAMGANDPEWKTTTDILADISPLTTRGDIMFRNATVSTRLAKGADNTILAMGANDPEWKTPATIMADLSGQAAADFSMNTNKITLVTDPSSAQDAATKNYVDTTAVLDALFDAHTILYAVSDNTPLALTVAASRIVGRKASGNISAMTGAETLALLTGANLDVGAFDVRGATLTADGLTSGRVVFAGASGVLSGDSDFTFSGDTLTVTKIASTTFTGFVTITLPSAVDSHLLLNGTARLNSGEQAIYVNFPSETVATNGIWVTLKSTVTSGDLTGIRSRVYGNAASAGANIRGAYLEAKMEASKFAAMLEGALLHADYSAGSITISGDVRGFTAHISQGAGLNAANLYGGLINIQTRGDETITSDDVGLKIRNEAVGGNGRQMDAGILIAEASMGGGVKGFGYGIDMNDVTIATAALRLAGDGTVVTIIGKTGEYLRIGDAATTGHSLNSEDDLMVSGILEVNGVFHPNAITLGGNVSGAGYEITNLDRQYYNETNILDDGSFEVGVSLWTALNSVTVVSEGTIVKLGSKSMKVTGHVAIAFGRVQHTLSASDLARYKGRKVTIGGWIRADSGNTGNRVKFLIEDSAGESSSALAPHDDTWYWETVTRTIDAGTTFIRIEAWASEDPAAADIGYFDGVVLVEGDSSPAFGDKPIFTWDAITLRQALAANGQNINNSGIIQLADTKAINTGVADNDYYTFGADDIGVGIVEVARVQGAANPYFQMTQPLMFAEVSAAIADIAGLGQVWVRDDAPNVLMFTNDLGADKELAVFDADTGEMIVVSNQTATIETADTPHAFTGLSTGDVQDFSFVAGLTGPIASYADYSGTVAGTILATDVGHGLVTGDIITIRGTTAPNNYNGIHQITRVDDDTFYFTDTWNADAGASDWEMGDYLLAGVGTTGEYDIEWNSSVSEGGGAGSIVLFCPMQNTTILTKASSKRKFANNDVGSISGGGHIAIVVADRIWFTHQSDGTNDLTVNLMNLRLSRLA